MYYTISNEEAKHIMSMPGEVSGALINKDKNFILKKGGRKKIHEVEENMSDFGYSFSYSKIKEKNFYPWGNRILSIISIASVFNMEKEKIEEMGRMTISDSAFRRIISRYFKKTEDILSDICHNWRKNNTIGRLELKEINKQEKKAVIVLYNLNFHAIFCDYFCGYLAGSVEISEGSSAVCKEENCYFNGNCDFHEFVIRW